MEQRARWRKVLFVAVTMAVAAALGVPLPAAAATIHVDCAGGEDLQTDGIDAADPGDVIAVGPGDCAGGFTIDKTLTLVGAGAEVTTLTGEGAGRVVDIDGTTSPGVVVVLQDLTITDGDTGESGGGIRNDGADVHVIGSAIESNTASGNGGGVSNSDGVLRLTGTSVTGNTALAGRGGGIFSEGEPGSVVLVDSQVEGNTASGNGGGIGFSTSDAGRLLADRSTIDGNEAGGSGGGVYMYDGLIRLEGSSVSDNTSGSSGGGIEIDDDGWLWLIDSNVDRNEAGGRGGGIEIEYSGLTMVDSTVDENEAGGTGGGIYHNDDYPVEIRNSSVSRNVSTSDGGGIYNDGYSGAYTIVDSNIDDNQAGGDGGGIYKTEGSLTIENSSVNDNRTGSGCCDEGGGIYFGSDDPALLTIRNSTVDLNWASDDGGGIYNGSYGFVLLEDSSVSGNVSDDGDGGGIYEDGRGLAAYNSNIDNNTSEYDGGGLYSNAVAVLADSSVSGNTSEDDYGGGIYNNDSLLRLERTVVNDNSAYGAGGGVYNSSDLLYAVDSTISGNVAGSTGSGYRGGGIYNSDDMVLLRVTVSNNEADYQGGGIYNSADGQIFDSIIDGNTSVEEGGGIYNSSELRVLGSTISNNTATDSVDGDGGGIYNDGELFITNSTVSGNTAENRGGGIYDNWLTVVSFTTIADNHAADDGGGIYNDDDVLLRASIVADNTAGGDGPDCYKDSTLDSYGYNVIGDATDCGFDAQFGDQVGEDPLLGPLTDNGGQTFTHALGGGSPAADLVPLAACYVADDQRGIARPAGSLCDAGAFEAPAGTGAAPPAPPAPIAVDCDDAGDLQTAITAASAGDVISVEGTCEGGFTIDKALTIVGAGAASTTLDGVGFGRVILIMPAAGNRGMPVTIEGVTITGGDVGGEGGGLNVTDVAVELVDSVVTGNQSTMSGGGIYSQMTSVRLTRTELSNNTAGGPGLTAHGGGIQLADPLAALVVADGSAVDDNEAATHGGGIHFGGDDGWLRVEDSTVDGNTAGTDFSGGGGGIYLNYGLMWIVNSSVSNNTADGSYGGGFTLENDGYTWVIGSNIDDNTASGNGGGIEHEYSGLYIQDSTVDRNTAGGDGGAFHTYDDYPVDIINSSISDNTAADGGGAIYNDYRGPLTIVDSVIEGNTAGNDGGGIYKAEGALQVVNSWISGNTASGDGGGVHIGDDGSTYAVFTGSTVADNSATTAFADGGGMYVYEYGTVFLDHTLVTENEADRDGGGIYEEGRLVVGMGSTVSDNTAGRDGGGIHSYGLTRAEAALINGNTAVSDGGGIYNDNVALELHDVAVADNESGADGGGVYSGYPFYAVDTSFTGNTASDQGGGVYLNDDAVLLRTMVGSNVAGDDGGGIYNDDLARLFDSTVSGNEADDDGGGIYNAGLLFIENTTISHNTAANGDGGGIYNDTDLYATNTTISDNLAPASDGGGIYNADDLVLNQSTVTGNTAGDDGGGVFNDDELWLRATIIAGNAAGFGVDCVDGRDLRSMGHNLIGDTTDCGFDAASTDRLNVNPQLGTLADNGGLTLTHALAAGSAAIDAVDLAGCMVNADQRGVERPNGVACDIGAFEFTPAGPGGGGGGVAPTSVTVRTGDNATADDPLVAAVTSPQGGSPTISVTSPATVPAPDGWTFLDFDVNVTAPDATAGNPLVIEFRLHESILPDGVDHTTVAVFREGVGPIPDCAGSSVADPDPCVSGRQTVGDEIVITVLSSQASVWSLGVAVTAPPAPQPGFAEACPPGQVPPSGFVDVPSTNTHAGAIDCVVWWEIALGTSATTYSPAADVTRAQMASFLGRVLDRAGVQVTPSRDWFADDDGNPHEARINQLAEAGIVLGLTDTTYGPSQPVTRAQMASFLVRTYEYIAQVELEARFDYFADDDGNVHEPAINKAAEAGFARGTTLVTFDPSSNVRRDQMASFLARVLDRLVQEGLAAAG